MATATVGVSLAAIAGCSADKVESSSSSPLTRSPIETTTTSTTTLTTTTSTITSTSTTTPADPGASASMELELIDYPDFREGFDYGVRLEIDGAITDERLLSDFEGGYREPVESSEWRTRFEVRAGEVTVVSDLDEGGPGAAGPPDFTDACRTVVTVEPGSEMTVVLNWRTGCVDSA